MLNKYILGVDPGSAKTGVALLTTEGRVVTTEVFSTQELAQLLPVWLAGRELSACVLGDGTTSLQLRAVLEGLLPQVPLCVVNEAHSTEEARALYYQLHPPTAWRRLVPRGLLAPAAPLDGYAAAVLGLRYLAQGKKTEESKQ